MSARVTLSSPAYLQHRTSASALATADDGQVQALAVLARRYRRQGVTDAGMTRVLREHNRRLVARRQAASAGSRRAARTRVS